jgi:hypothetical protein
MEIPPLSGDFSSVYQMEKTMAREAALWDFPCVGAAFVL